MAIVVESEMMVGRSPAIFTSPTICVNQSEIRFIIASATNPSLTTETNGVVRDNTHQPSQHGPAWADLNSF
jgi:hypothetical protein